MMFLANDIIILLWKQYKFFHIQVNLFVCKEIVMSRTSPPKYVKQILFTLQARGHLAYLVGGCVRDMLMETVPQDWDICTSALPEEVMELFPGSRPTGLKHGTVTVIIGSRSAEVTTFRTEGDYRDHRRPEAVHFVSELISDLSRRDFTVNAIALSADGLISDPYGGISDIENRIIRCVGEPERRFNEDALRMFRALRFSARLGFSIDYETLSAIERCADTANMLAPERVRDEIGKILLTARPETVGVIISFGLLKKYIPHTEKKAPNFSKLCELPKKALTRWAVFAMMLRDGGCIDSTEDFLLSLRLDGRTVRCCCAADAMLRSGLPSDKLGWKRLLNRYGVDSVSCAAVAHDLMRGTGCTGELRAVLKSGECFSMKHLAVTGDDLLELGLTGKELGEMLRFLLDYVMEYPEKNRREILLGLVYSEES